jgi:hypothetical protein
MLLTDRLDSLEQEKAEMWDIFAFLLDFDVGFTFTAKELSKHTSYTKKQLNQYLYRLFLQNALKTNGNASNGATIYSLNPDFLTSEQ